MPAETVVDVVQRIGLPLAILAIVAGLLWRVDRHLMSALVTSYKERIAALETERDHFRARSEQLEDEARTLGQSMIADIRRTGMTPAATATAAAHGQAEPRRTP